MVNQNLLSGFASIMRRGGKIISIRYYNQISDDVYDEPINLLPSGNTVWTSGIVFTLDPNSSEDNLLLEQGKINMSDQKLYTHGSLLYNSFTGSTLQTKIGIGSPTSNYFSIIPLGANAQEMSNVQVYKLAYIRKLTNGSLYGE